MSSFLSVSVFHRASVQVPRCCHLHSHLLSPGLLSDRTLSFSKTPRRHAVHSPPANFSEIPEFKFTRFDTLGSKVAVRSMTGGKPTSNRAELKTDSSCKITSGVSKDDRLFKYCSQCGNATERRIPPGDERARDICLNPSCGLIHYANPKIVVGAICLWEGKVLLCKRAIEPCIGKWGFPQGFLELGETSEEGAEREVREEANAAAKIGNLLAVYNIPNQLQLIYLAKLESVHMSPGHESLEVRLVDWDEIPNLDIAFPTVTWALQFARSVQGKESFPPERRTKTFSQLFNSSSMFRSPSSSL